MPRRAGRWWLLALVAALVAFFLPPLVNVNRFRKGLAENMSAALGRKVTVGGVSLRLLPQPGFDLHRVAVADDPAFGAEPMVRADEVTAVLRLGSLWRGRLEVAKLTLKSGADISPPSLNLVRASDGRWNVEALLQRAAQTPSAPTTKVRAEGRPRFPYIEAGGGRINFKIGQEKKVYALTEADFALWLPSKDEWAFRLAARPVRTDFNLGNTGVLKISGRVRRAAQLRDTPLELSVSAQDAQLGQLTTLIYGRDRGWRGTVQASAQITGVPGAMKVTLDAAVQDFRRYDVNTTERLRLDAHCGANYSTRTERLSEIDCQVPLGSGFLRARGEVSGLLEPSSYHLELAAEHVSVQSLVALARHAKHDIPSDLTARGGVDAAFTASRSASGAAPQWEGNGHSTEVVLTSSVLQPELPVPELSFAIQGPELPAKKAARRRPPVPSPEAPRLAITAFRLPLGAANPAEVSAWFSHEQYEMDAQGDARIERLFQAGRALGLRVPQYKVEGGARLALHVTGNWLEFLPPVITGSAQLRNVNATAEGINAPVHIAAANLWLSRDAAILQNLAATLAGVDVGGWLRVARGCASVEQCPVQFELHSDQLSLDDLNRLLNPSFARRPWYEVFGRRSAPLLGRVQASGKIAIGHFALRTVIASHFSANAELDAGKLLLTEVKAEVLGGRHRGEWRADFTGGAPEYTGSGKLESVALPQLATLMRDNWAAGTVNAAYQITLSGWSAGEVAASANGVGSFDWRNGVLRHVALDGGSGPLQFKSFAGRMEVREGALVIPESKMATPAGIYLVSGTASLGRQLRLKLRNGGLTYDISGPLDRPRVTSISATQAALQP